MIMNIYRKIDRTQVQFDFVIHDGIITPLAEEAIALGGRVYTCPKYTVKTAFAYGKWWKNFFVEHTEYKTVHSHVRSTAAIVLKIAKKRGCVAIAHSHSTSSGKGVKAVVKNLLQRRIRRVADYFFACSPTAGEWLFGKKACASPRYFTLRNAIDVEAYDYTAQKAEEARAELGFSPKDVVIGHMGRFTEPKNHRFLIEIFAELYRRNPRYKLLLVGDGELRHSTEEEIRRRGLERVVTLAGLRQDAARMMMAMDFFVFPSKWEGLGMVMIEAQATGCSCLASSEVPKDAQISALAEFYGLDKTAAEWADKIEEGLKRVQTVPRKAQTEAVVRGGYDVRASAKWLQEFYLQAQEGK